MIRILLLILSAAALAFAQPAGALRGIVTDPDGAAVPEARALLYRADSNARLATRTDTAGTFSFERLQPGLYFLEVDKGGFSSLSQQVTVTATEETRLDVQLRLRQVPQTVVVTATDSPLPMDQISKAITVVSGEEVRNRNEFSVAEALRTVPGIQVLNLGGPGQQTTIRTRGLRPDATAILVDGMRFRDASTLQSDASSLIASLNFTGADRVEVLRGSGSSLYGTNAVGGAINVITRDGGGPLRTSILTEGGGLGLFRGRASMGGGAWNDRLRYSGSLLHLNVINGVDGNDAARNTSGQGFLRYDFTPTLHLTGRVWAADDFAQTNASPGTAGIPAANFPSQGVVPVRFLSPANVRILQSGGQPDFTGVTLIPGLDDPDARRAARFATTAITLRHTPTARLQWQAAYQRMHAWRVFEDAPGGPGFQPQGNNFGNYVGINDTADLRGTGWVAPWLTLTGGLEFDRESYFDRLDNNLPGTRRVATETRVQQNAYSPYFSSQMALFGRRLQVVASGRGQFFDLSRPRFQLAGTANNYESFPLAAPPRALTGDLSVSYFIGATNTKLRAHTGNAYRAPSLYERFGGGFGANPATGIVSFTPYGDPRLAPDRYNNVDAGIDQYLFDGRVRASATWFYTRIVSVTAFDFSGAISPATDPFGRFFGYINGSGGITRGAELSVEAKPTRSTIVTVAYTHVKAGNDRGIPVATFFRPGRVHEHVTSFVVSHDWSRRFNTTVDHFYMSSAYDFYFAVSGSRPFLNPGFQKTDLVASYLVWEGERRSARLYGKVDNLFDRTYYHAGWLAPGATGLLGLNLQF